MNAPGIFRVSGQASIVNALYDYYAHQFSAAGSPSKVQATVQPGQLPLHIEYTLHDVATFFKKVVKGLPGGLLGSLEVFEAIAGVVKLNDIPSLKDEEMTALRAKLIALNFLSISSLHRFNLIQAVFGLFAYLGHEAELARENQTESRPPHQTTSELMGYQALGVCLGPLLVGDLIDNVENFGIKTDDMPKGSMDGADKPKKKRSSIMASKLQNSSSLSALIDRANLTANVMQTLLMIWHNVVKQLRIATASSKSVESSTVHGRPRTSSRKASKHSIRVTEEELLLLNMLRAGEMPQGFPYDVVVKRKIKAKSKSSMSRLANQVSNNSSLQRDWFHEDAERNAISHVEGSHQQQKDLAKAAPVQRNDGIESQEAGVTALRKPSSSTEGNQTASDANAMTSGQILTPRKDLQDVYLTHSGRSESLQSTYLTPSRHSMRHRTTNSTPEASTSHRVHSGVSIGTDAHRRAHTLEKLALPQKKGLPPPPVEPAPQREASFPPRHSSLDRHPLPANDNVSTTRACSPGSESSEQRPGLNSTRMDDAYWDSLSRLSQRQGAPSFSSSIANTGRGMSMKDSAPKLEVPFIPPFEKGQATLEDPFVTISGSNTPKKRDSLIPKPISDLGRRREKTGRSPSSKRKSVFNIVIKDVEILSKPITPTRQVLSSDHTRERYEEQRYGTGTSRPLSTYSVNSLSQLEQQPSNAPPARRLNYDTQSRNVSSSSVPPDTSSAAIDHSLANSLSSRGCNATNNTLFAEITRLKRQLDQKEEVILATRRSLSAARLAKEEGPSPSDSYTPKRGSWSKGTLSHEVREVKKSRDVWKQRAEWAERRLSGAERRAASEDTGLSKVSDDA